MSRFDTDRGQGLFFSEDRFTFPLTGSVTSDYSFQGKESFTDLRIKISEQDTSNVKPHVLLLDSKGHVVLNVGARAQGAYSLLLAHAHDSVASFRWTKNNNPYGNSYMTCWVRFGDQHVGSSNGGKYPQLFLDTETTGLDPNYDEILQLAIVDGEGRVIWDRKYKPENHLTWPEAEAIHHISPSSVSNKPSIHADLQEIQAILDAADNVYAFNAPFDFAFLGNAGLRCDSERTHDTMREYARKVHGSEYIKLTEAAKEVGHSYKPHDAKADCIATMQVQRSVDGKPVMTSDDFAKRDMKPCEVTAMRHKWIMFYVLLVITVLLFALTPFAPWVLLLAIPAALFTWGQAHSNELQAQINEAAGLPSGREQRRLLRSKSRHVGQ